MCGSGGNAQRFWNGQEKKNNNNNKKTHNIYSHTVLYWAVCSRSWLLKSDKQWVEKGYREISVVIILTSKQIFKLKFFESFSRHRDNFSFISFPLQNLWFWASLFKTKCENDKLKFQLKLKKKNKNQATIFQVHANTHKRMKDCDGR